MSDRIAAAGISRLGLGQSAQLIILIGLLAFSNLGMVMVALTPQLLSLALKVEQLAPETATRDLSLMLGAGFAVQVLVLIMVGRLSDFTRSRFGMRRPWIIGGLIMVVFASLLMITADNVIQLWVGFGFLSIGVPCCISSLYATIPDQIPQNRQGLASGLIGASGVVGVFVGTFLVQTAPGNDLVAFGFPCAMAVVMVTLYVCVLPDKRLTNHREINWSIIGKAFVINRQKSPNLGKFIAGVAVANVSFAVISSYTFYVLGGLYGIAVEDLPRMTFIAQMTVNVIALLFTLAAGPLTDRFGGKFLLFKFAAPFFTVGVLLVAFGHTLVVGMIGFALVGIAHGLFGGLYLAVGAACSGDEKNSARDINLVAAASTVPNAAVPLFAPLLLGGGGDNFVLLLVVAALVTLIAIPLNQRVKYAPKPGAASWNDKDEDNESNWRERDSERISIGS